MDSLKTGFLYTVRHRAADGSLLSEERVHNLVPTVGLNYILNAAIQGGTPSASWYIGVFANNYTPVAGDTVNSIVTTGGEFTDYAEATRQDFTSPDSTAGLLTNADSLAVITASSATTIYGGFICNASTKGGTSGTLLSAVKFSSAKAMAIDERLEIEATLTLGNA
jgi:hypothetical protein